MRKKLNLRDLGVILSAAAEVLAIAAQAAHQMNDAIERSGVVGAIAAKKDGEV